jgi:hypothetical protein
MQRLNFYLLMLKLRKAVCHAMNLCHWKSRGCFKAIPGFTVAMKSIASIMNHCAFLEGLCVPFWFAWFV